MYIRTQEYIKIFYICIYTYIYIDIHMVLQRMMEQLLDCETSCCRGLGPPPTPHVCTVIYFSDTHVNRCLFGVLGL